MTVLTPPGYLQAGSYSALLDRQYSTNHHFQPKNGDPSRARAGILPAPDNWSGAITVAGLNISISPFRCIVENNNAAGAGEYKGTSLATETRAMAASSPTLNRIDVIGARVRDAFYSGAFNDIDVFIVQGTAVAGTPAVPSLPNGYMPMYQLQLNANATTPTVVDVRVRTSPMGAVYTPFASQVSAAGTYPGELKYLPASGAMPARLVIWGADGQWHGTAPFALDFANYNLSYAQINRGIADLTVPDPGYPYKISLQGQVASAMDGNTGWDFTVYTPTTGGTVIGTAAQLQIRDPDNSFTGDNTRAMSGFSAVRTGSTAMELWCERNYGASTQGIVVTPVTKVGVLVVPA